VRTLFLVLVLANLAFYVWSRYGDAADTAAPARQIEPQKLKVIAPADLPKPAPAAKKAAPGPAPAPAATVACMEWGSFPVADAPRYEKALEPLSLGERLAQRRTEELAGWWVYIPSQRNRQAALRKANELRNLGIDQFFIVQEDGEHRWALSLGVFRSEEAAQAHLAALRTRGVRTARVGARETMVPKVWLQVKSVDAPLAARLKEIASQVEGSELRNCP
jgi:hypothetical protein